jgi:hypothetical protein
MNRCYSENEIRKIKYLLRRISELKNGHTLSAQFTEGYPFLSYMDRFGKVTLSDEALQDDCIYQFLQDNPQISEKVDLIEIAWQYYLVYGTPNGDLFKRNSLFESVNHGKGLTMIHVTNNLDGIIQSKFLYPSGGALGASIYCVPLRADGKIHNLSKFIAEYELPKFLDVKGVPHNINYLAIHIEQENFISSNQEANGLDYLQMGPLQLELYKKFKRLYGLQHPEAFNKLEEKIVSQIDNTQDFLKFCVDYKVGDISTAEFVKRFEKAIETLPFLGYLYFEVLLEYIVLFQDDELSVFLHEQGEINNYHYKTMIFELCPSLFQNFKLLKFRPKVSEVLAYFKEKSAKGLIFTNFIEGHFLEFFKWRLAQYVRYKLLGKAQMPETIEFESLCEQVPALIGHLMHIELMQDDSLKHKSSTYTKFRATQLWKMWNDERVVIPYNSIVPKGEIGVNPVYKNLDHKVYLAKLDPKTNQVTLGEELDIKLSFKLVRPKFTTMATQLGESQKLAAQLINKNKIK